MGMSVGGVNGVRTSCHKHTPPKFGTGFGFAHESQINFLGRFGEMGLQVGWAHDFLFQKLETGGSLEPWRKNQLGCPP